MRFLAMITTLALVALFNVFPVSKLAAREFNQKTCYIEYGQTIKVEVRGTSVTSPLSCEFEGKTGDIVEAECNGCEDIEIRSVDGIVIKNGVLPATSTYKILMNYDFGTREVQGDCVAWVFDVYPDGETNYGKSICTAYNRSTYEPIRGEVVVSLKLKSSSNSTNIGTPAVKTAVPNAMLTICSSSDTGVTVTINLEELLIIDPEEADTTSIIGGDEIELGYGIRIPVQTTGKTTYDYGPADKYYEEWEFNGSKNSRFKDIGSVTRTVPCGKTIEALIYIVESDAPFGGSNEIGFEVYSLKLESNSSIVSPFRKTVQMKGRTNDGTFNYSVTYSVSIKPA